MALSRASLVSVRPSSGDTSIFLVKAKLHLVDKRGCHKYDWETYHALYVALLATRVERIVTSLLMAGIMDFHDPYMECYQHIT